MPLFVLVANLGLVNTHAGLILPFLAGAFGVFLMRQFIGGIPDELLDAARVDGAGEHYIFWRIVMPLCGPARAATCITIPDVSSEVGTPLALGGGHHGRCVHLIRLRSAFPFATG